MITGGLGPTEDDLTRDAVAAALGRKLIFNDEILAWIEQRFRLFNRQNGGRQSTPGVLIEGAEVLPNPRGTAPGQWIDLRSRSTSCCCPARRSELKPLFRRTNAFRDWERFAAAGDSRTFLSRGGHGRIGSRRADRAGVHANRQSRDHDSGGHGRYPGASASACRDCRTTPSACSKPSRRRLKTLLGDRIYSRNGDLLEKVIGGLLRDRHATLSVAESVTGGIAGAADHISRGEFRLFPGRIS